MSSSSGLPSSSSFGAVFGVGAVGVEGGRSASLLGSNRPRRGSIIGRSLWEGTVQ